MAEVALTCQELVELVTDYLEDSLPAGERARFEQHLARCQGCRNYLRQMKTTIAIAGRLTAESLPPGAREEMLAIFRRWKSAAAARPGPTRQAP
jgi:anti-sigma factor RsiW